MKINDFGKENRKLFDRIQSKFNAADAKVDTVRDNDLTQGFKLAGKMEAYNEVLLELNHSYKEYLKS